MGPSNQERCCPGEAGTSGTLKGNPMALNPDLPAAGPPWLAIQDGKQPKIESGNCNYLPLAPTASAQGG